MASPRPKQFHTYLACNEPIYSCQRCQTHITAQHNIVTKMVMVMQGKAYLVDGVVNVNLLEPQTRFLLSGIFRIADLACKGCRTKLGWTYLTTSNPSHLWRVGKHLLLKDQITKDNNWD